MSQTRDEIEARHIAEYLEELEQADRSTVDERIRNGFELSKINSLSKGCKRFLNSEIGRYLQNEAAEQAEAAKDKLANIKMKDFKNPELYLDEIKELQFEAYIPALVITWLYRAIHKAKEEAELNYEE